MRSAGTKVTTPCRDRGRYETAGVSPAASAPVETPKSGKGEVEMIRMLKSAKNSAVTARTQAVNQIKALVITAPAELRETLDDLTTSALIKRCRSFRPGRPRSPMAAAKYALRSLACRYSQLSKEIHDLRAELQQLIQATAPALVEAYGIGPDTAAALLVAAGSNPDRLHSEAAFASLCGVNPDTCFVWQDQPASAQPWWRSPGQCGAISHSSRQAAPRPEDAGVPASTKRRRDEQKVVVPEVHQKTVDHPYHKDRFIYDETTDTYTCPQGQSLRFAQHQFANRAWNRVYRSPRAVCLKCPAKKMCTSDGRRGRRIVIGPHDLALRRHREWMSTDAAKREYQRRKYLVEPVFGIIKEQMGVRRFLLRGLPNVTAEWAALATAFNLRTLWRAWRSGQFTFLPTGPGCLSPELR